MSAPKQPHYPLSIMNLVPLVEAAGDILLEAKLTYKGAQSWWGGRLACLANSLVVHVNVFISVEGVGQRGWTSVIKTKNCIFSSYLTKMPNSEILALQQHCPNTSAPPEWSIAPAPELCSVAPLCLFALTLTNPLQSGVMRFIHSFAIYTGCHSLNIFSILSHVLPHSRYRSSPTVCRSCLCDIRAAYLHWRTRRLLWFYLRLRLQLQLRL
jgi:hypothetical protein